MAKETSASATAQPEQPQGKMSGHEDDSKLPGSFHPHHITLETFRRLLSHYSSTVEQAHSRKIRSKLHSRSKSAKVSKRKVEKASAASTTNAELDPSEEKQIREETEKFLQLDRWRYELLPKIIAGRKATQGINETGEKGAYLLKEELLDIMEWKL